VKYDPRRKGEGGILCGLLPKLLALGRTIYTWELYVVITNIQRNKE
jgi:hypothetical protein